ncbi:peptide ABC transporter ATP-binding protein [Salmonella enterica subsp. arizonae]|nr:peptide ABC transporter ATP-binding protein [Salmonella enterica subsp. arizonae]
MLSCRDLVICHGGKVLWQNLTFAISAGERVGIHAPSGTGEKRRWDASWPDGKSRRQATCCWTAGHYPCISIVRYSLFPSILN